MLSQVRRQRRKNNRSPDDDNNFILIIDIVSQCPHGEMKNSEKPKRLMTDKSFANVKSKSVIDENGW